MTLHEALDGDLRTRIEKAKAAIIKNLSKYAFKVMSYKNNNIYSLNIMMNDNYNKLKDKSKIHNDIKLIANESGGKLDIRDDSVIKIKFEEQ